MGNVCSISISCDAIFSRCLDCTVRRAAYIRELEANLDALQTERQRLSEVRNDMLRRVMAAEQRMMKRTEQVQGWLSRVEVVEAEADKLISDSPQEIEKLFVGGYCSANCKSSYKYGKQVVNKLKAASALIGQGAFEVLAERAPESVADERPTEPNIVGLQSTLEKVWRCLVEEPAGIVGLYGMGGVGKTTLLTQINNKFLKEPNDFDCVIWVVVSKDEQLEKIQKCIGEKIGLFNDSWKNKSLEEKALDIFRNLRDKKFVLLLDDIWERVDLTKVGVPLLGAEESLASKIVFTTRSINVCGSMEAYRRFKVECLFEEQAWELFQNKVGEETLNSHPNIPELAKLVARQCGGLPLALITIGRAMAYKKTPEEWRYAIEVLRRSASKFAGLEKEVYSLLKFSYDSLTNGAIKSCFLYCCLYPEDFIIFKIDLIDCWIYEGILDESDWFGAQNQGYYYMGTLVHACLLEEYNRDYVKMHDVVRDMALWISCEIEQEKENFIVYAGRRLTKAPNVRSWEKVRKLSLMQNQIKKLPEVPTCPHLLTLFLDDNENLEMITNDFFQFMPSLKVLKMSNNTSLSKLPLGISKLVSLQLLDISFTNIEEIPEELKALENLKCLNLDGTHELITIPRIYNFSKLRVLRMFRSGINRHHEASNDSILFGGGEVLVEELLGLKYLEVLNISLRSFNALRSLLSSHKLRNCTQALSLECFEGLTSLDVSLLEDLKHLDKLSIWRCQVMEELKIDYNWEVQKTRQPYVFHSLRDVTVSGCHKLKDLTFLIFAPNLESIFVNNCSAMEEIISAGKFVEIPEMIGNISPFAKLQRLVLQVMANLKCIYWKPLLFPHLKNLTINCCYELKKLPLDSNSAKECKIVISGIEDLWRGLEWEDEATQNAFLPRVKFIWWTENERWISAS